MDAVDVALVDFIEQKPTLLATLSYPIPEEFRAQCLAVSKSGQCAIDDFCRLDVHAGELFAKAILALLKENQVSPQHIRAIGSHGQNLRHCPNVNPPFTLQIGDPNVISERTGITTISDFRRRDIAAGGQGAPLAPAFHATILGSSQEDRVIVNVGGINNLTILPKDQTLGVTGFDTGPGNCLMDAWIQKHLKKSYDQDGKFARSGNFHPELLNAFLSEPYFALPPPKSTGIELFNEAWITKNIATLKNFEGTPQDVQATLLLLTARVIRDGILHYAPKNSAVYLCGGGTHNSELLKVLSQELQREVKSTEALGVPPDWVEAMLFAWLARQTLTGKSGNYPAVTGARHARTLGGIFGYTLCN